MKHPGWKIVFGISWLPALFLYTVCVEAFIKMGDKGTSGGAAGLAFFAFLIPSILFIGLQSLFGFLAFRK